MTGEELITVPERTREIGKRRLQILKMLSHGWKELEIAHEMHLSMASVKRDIKTLRNLFGARNATHLVAIAYEKGILGSTESVVNDVLTNTNTEDKENV